MIFVGYLAAAAGMVAFAAWAQAEWRFRPYRQRGVVRRATVQGKFARATTTRTGTSTAYSLLLRYEGPDTAVVEVADFVFGARWRALCQSDVVEVLVLAPPEHGVVLRDVVESRAGRPLILRVDAWVAPLALAGLCFALHFAFGA